MEACSPRTSNRSSSIGEYRILGVICRTDHSTVRLCEHKENGQRVAIKSIPLASTQHTEALQREIRVLAGIRHDHVVAFTGALRSQRTLHIVEEYCEGGDLLNVIPAHGFTEVIAHFYFSQLVKGLAAVHAAGIVHRDLKPENLLLSADRRTLKIADFGLSADNSRPMLTTSCGTPYYCAPEVVTRASYDGFAADIWSVGVILYHLLNGTVPFLGKTFGDLYASTVVGSYSWHAPASPAARRLVRRLLAPDPAQRITMYEMQRHPWSVYGPAASSVAPAGQRGCVFWCDVVEETELHVQRILDPDQIRNDPALNIPIQ